ncbi:MAG TPA: biotin/lipoyl-binding protein, partial [Longimicrobium sp.]|nr:biotin/lipoyl-binding protein [Longimicrobium sp.]
MWKKHRRKIVLAVLGIAVLAMVVSAMRPEPLEVDAAPVRRGTLRVTVDEDGVTRVHDRYVIAAPVAGRLERIALREGDRVEPGTVVARLASAPLDVRTGMRSTAAVAAAQAAVAQADARVSEARAALEQA